ncbi:MAG: hypothetical protein JNJ85_15845 [Candidatus Kapabacteria bacterium]|nr:hypothetical protein [Candidatus Kapabacteria bacterium]
MSIANFVTAIIMFVAYFIISKYVDSVPNQDIGIKPYWFLIAGILFVIAGAGIFLFVNYLQKKYKNIN